MGASPQEVFVVHQSTPSIDDCGLLLVRVQARPTAHRSGEERGEHTPPGRPIRAKESRRREPTDHAMAARVAALLTRSHYGNHLTVRKKTEAGRWPGRNGARRVAAKREGRWLQFVLKMAAMVWCREAVGNQREMSDATMEKAGGVGGWRMAPCQAPIVSWLPRHPTGWTAVPRLGDAVAAREIANGNAAIKHRYKRPMPCTPPSPRDSGLMTPTDGCLCSVPGPPAARWVWLFIDLVVRLAQDLKARATASTKLESPVQAVCPAIHAGPGRVGRRSMVVRPCTGLQAAAPIFLKWHALSGR